MKKRKHSYVNKYELTFIGLLALVIFSLIIGLVDKPAAKVSGDNVVIPESTNTVSIDPETTVAFANSRLNKSIAEAYNQAKEKEKSTDENTKSTTEKKNDQTTQKVDSKGNKIVYLTFDDGPSAVTNQLLNMLEKHHLRATFFMLGPNMKEYSSSVKRMADEGFGVGLHGITHQANKIYRNAHAPVNEMVAGQEILQDITGIKTDLIRLPYGSIPYLTNDMRTLLDMQHFQIWDWNVDSEDWKLGGASFIANTVNQIKKIEGANEIPVILLHDRPSTVKYVNQLFNYLDQHGYTSKILTNDMPALTFECEGRCHPYRQ